jgi:hypothetical protein
MLLIDNERSFNNVLQKLKEGPFPVLHYFLRCQVSTIDPIA